MSRESHEWILSLRSIESEFRVATIGMTRLADHARRDPTVLGLDLRYRVVGKALRNLNATYAIRIFAEFETGLRHFWTRTRSEPEPRSVAQIIDRIAARHGIIYNSLRNCHRVRQYRNRQVHDNEEEGETLDVSECRGYLCTFLGQMPLDWSSHIP